MLYYAKNIKICYMWWFCDDFDNAGAVLWNTLHSLLFGPPS
jgi:hypothetical protein